MTTLSAPGIGSGLDIGSIITKLMDVERQPLLNLVKEEAELQAGISLMGSIKGALAGFQASLNGLEDADTLNSFNATSSDADVLSVSASTGAALGAYQIDVTRLAQAHKFGSDAKADSDTFGGGADDAFTIIVDGESLTVDLSSAKTLAEIRDDINNSTSGAAVQATLLNEDAGGSSQRLILTSQETGSGNQLSVSFAGSIDTDTFGFATLNKDENDVVLSNLDDLDASVTVDGFSVTRGTNTLDDVLDNVSITLTQAGSTSVEIERGGNKITTAALNMVNAFNSLTTELDNANTRASSDVVRNIRSGLRSTINDAFKGLGDFSILAQLGITTTEEGKLELDAGKLGSAVSDNLDSVVAFFTDENGFTASLNNKLDQLQDDSGVIVTRTDRLNNQVERLQTRQGDLEERLENTEDRIRREFTALDGLLARMDVQSQFIQQQLDGLNALTFQRDSR